MEAIDLKATWKLFQEEVIKKDLVGEKSFANNLHTKSKSEISQIERGLHRKFIIASLVVVFALAIAILTFVESDFNPLDKFFSPQEATLFYIIMALSITVMVFFNYKAYKTIKSIQQSSQNLKENLNKFIAAMESAMNFNILSDTLMTPIIFAWLYYAYAFKNHELGFDLRSCLLFILPVMVSFISYFLQKYMQHLKFGQYVKRLKEYLASLKKN